MAETMMNRRDRIRAMHAAGRLAEVPVADLRAEVAWRRSAGLLPAAAEGAEEDRDALVGLISGKPAAAKAEQGQGQEGGGTRAGARTSTRKGSD